MAAVIFPWCGFDGGTGALVNWLSYLWKKQREECLIAYDRRTFGAVAAISNSLQTIAGSLPPINLNTWCVLIDVFQNIKTRLNITAQAIRGLRLIMAT